MAEIAYSIVQTGRDYEGVALVKWAALGNGDTGAPFKFPRHTDRSVHVKGTFGAGGTCLIEASLEVAPATYATLNDRGEVGSGP